MPRPNNLDHIENSPDKKFPWAFFIVIVVSFLFGLFWYFEKKLEQNSEISTTQNIKLNQTPAAKESPELNLSEIQTAAANLAIPDFSKDF